MHSLKSLKGSGVTHVAKVYLSFLISVSSTLKALLVTAWAKGCIPLNILPTSSQLLFAISLTRLVLSLVGVMDLLSEWFTSNKLEKYWRFCGLISSRLPSLNLTNSTGENASSITTDHSFFCLISGRMLRNVVVVRITMTPVLGVASLSVLMATCDADCFSAVLME